MGPSYPYSQRWRETRLRAGDDGYDISPSLAVDGEGKVWLAWSLSNACGRLNHRFAHRRNVHVRVLDPGTGTQAIPAGCAARGSRVLGIPQSRSGGAGVRVGVRVLVAVLVEVGVLVLAGDGV